MGDARVCFVFVTEMKNTIMGALCHDTHGLVPAYAVHQPGKFSKNFYKIITCFYLYSVLCAVFFFIHVCEIIRLFHFRHQIHDKKNHFIQYTLLDIHNTDTDREKTVFSGKN